MDTAPWIIAHYRRAASRREHVTARRFETLTDGNLSDAMHHAASGSDDAIRTNSINGSSMKSAFFPAAGEVRRNPRSR
jgi:hypothetical protein